MKAQAVRVADVFLVGPLMVRAGDRLGGPEGRVLAWLGLLTIIYNGANWLQKKTGPGE